MRAQCWDGCGRELIIVEGLGAFELAAVPYAPGVDGAVWDRRAQGVRSAHLVTPAPRMCNPRHLCPSRGGRRG